MIYMQNVNLLSTCMNEFVSIQLMKPANIHTIYDIQQMDWYNLPPYPFWQAHIIQLSPTHQKDRKKIT